MQDNNTAPNTTKKRKIEDLTYDAEFNKMFEDIGNLTGDYCDDNDDYNKFTRVVHMRVLHDKIWDIIQEEDILTDGDIQCVLKRLLKQ